jgi:hypothetical protein
MSYDPDDFFAGGGAPALSWKNVPIGTTYRGKIIDQTVEDQTDDDGAVRTFASGDPMKQLVLTIQTDLRNGDGMSEQAKGRLDSPASDDGLRRLYVKGYMTKAVKEAVRKAGERSTKVGGTIAVRYVEDGQRTSATKNPPKLYKAKYEAPSVDMDDFGDDEPEPVVQQTPAMAGAPSAPSVDDF